MSLQHLDLTTALRPSLLPDESLLFVQDDVGLYQGKLKIAHLQQGQAYLTSHRACYVDNEEPRRYSVAINLKDVDSYEFYAGFLKSSPKVTLHLKPLPRRGSAAATAAGRDVGAAQSLASPASGGVSPLHGRPSTPVNSSVTSATWICPICSFSNALPPNADPASVTAQSPIAACLSCGIKPPWTHILRATIAAASQTHASQLPAQGAFEHGAADGPRRNTAVQSNGERDTDPMAASVNQRLRSTRPCPRCTFLNDPGLVSCEMCGGPLVDTRVSSISNSSVQGRPRGDGTGSPGASIGVAGVIGHEVAEIKFSFRNGGEKVFYERLKNALIQRKWLLQGAPAVPRPLYAPDPSPRQGGTRPSAASTGPSGPAVAGIAGLEQRDLAVRKQNELVIGNAFEDLEALMTSAKEIVALAERFAEKMPTTAAGGTAEASAVLSRSATALGLVTTKDMLSSGSASDNLYLSQLSRNLAEFLTDDATGVLRREGGIMSLVDLWAVFNRARGGVELVSPTDLRKAVDMWEKLRLPLRLRRFKSGLLVVQSKDWTDDKTLATLTDWLQSLHDEIDALDPPFPVAAGPSRKPAWDTQRFGRGVTPRETAERFGWSVGVATEELEMAEEKGFLCREESVEGVRFWENHLVGGAAEPWREGVPPGNADWSGAGRTSTSVAAVGSGDAGGVTSAVV